MSTLGSLGGKRRRSSTNGVLGGLGKLTSPTQWTIDSGEWPSTVSNAVVKSWTRWNELAYPGSGLTASSTTITPWKVGQVLKLPSSWVPGGATATAPTSTTGDYGLPFKVGVKDATCEKWQYMLNSELGARGIKTVPEDGVFSALTCAGFTAFVKSYQAAPDEPTPDDTFAQLVVKYQSGIVAACAALTKPVAAPLAPPPPAPPAAPAVSVTELMRQQQTMLNQWLVSVGYNPISVTGVWDAATCGAGQLMVKTLPDSDPRKVALAGVLAKIKPLAGMPCGVTVQAAAMTKPAAPPPSGAQLLQMQQLLNSEVLRPNGYRTIAETGKLSAETCGAASDAASSASVGKIKISTTLQNLLNHPGLLPVCLPIKPWTFPQIAPPPAPPPGVARSSALPPLNKDGECVINFGQKYGEIGVLQSQLNNVLQQNGYKPIPITNVWDAQTCGAMFELGGKFSPPASPSCPHFYSVPLSCPTVVKPVKPAIPLPPPPKPMVIVMPPVPVRPPPPVKKASLALPIGIAAVVGVGLLALAKKKGLIMAAKKGRCSVSFGVSLNVSVPKVSVSAPKITPPKITVPTVPKIAVNPVAVVQFAASVQTQNALRGAQLVNYVSAAKNASDKAALLKYAALVNAANVKKAMQLIAHAQAVKAAAAAAKPKPKPPMMPEPVRRPKLVATPPPPPPEPPPPPPDPDLTPAHASAEEPVKGMSTNTMWMIGGGVVLAAVAAFVVLKPKSKAAA